MRLKHRKFLSFQLFTGFQVLFIWFKVQAMVERARWPLWLPVLLGCGIGVYFALPVEPPLMLGWMMAGGFAALTLWLRAKHLIGRAILAAGVCAFALGIGVAGVRTWWVAAPVLSHEIGPLSISGQVAVLEKRTKGLRVTLEKLTIQGFSPDKVPQTVRVTLMGAQPSFVAGDWLTVRGKLSPPPGPAAPGAFDFQRQSYFRGLGGVGFSFGPAKVVGTAPQTGVASLGYAFQRLRSSISARVRAQIDGPAGEVAAALTTGARGGIPKDILDAMRASGLAHLLAISGLHVGLVAGIVFFAVRAILAIISPLALRYPIKKWAAVGAISGALFYALIAGATVPTQRAFLMVGLVLLAVLTDRRALSMRSVAWAALAILLFAPEALLGASFQLSFAAVVALIATYEVLRQHEWLHAKDGSTVKAVGRYILGVAITTLVAGLATAAFAAFHFNRVADYSLAANLFAVPLTALWIMPWGVLAFALMPFGLEGLALAPMGWGIEAVVWVAKTVSSWPGSQRMVPAFPTWGLVVFALGGLWAALWQGSWRRWGILPATIGLLSVFVLETPDILIDATGKLAAVKTKAGGYNVSTLTAKRFERDVWLRRAGLDAEEGRWPKASATDHQVVRCDAQGCAYQVKGRGLVAFVHAPEALLEDCRATVVINLSGQWGADGAKACPAKVRIGLGDLARDGTHALYFVDDERGANQNGIRVETVREARGDRPWVLPAPPPRRIKP